MSRVDVEKIVVGDEHSPAQKLTEVKPESRNVGFFARIRDYMLQWEKYLIRYNLEARGLQRVLPEETHAVTWRNYLQAFLLWISINLAANNITLGMLGPAVFYLSFRDAVLCAVFGAIVGSLPVAYVSTFGPRSGNRTMVFVRYTFGWWPTKLIVILNIIVFLGYALIDLVIAGQILSAISVNGSLNIVVGIIVVAFICWIISTFGISLFNFYQHYAWLPQLIAISILFAASANHFDLATPSAGNARTVAASRLSFFSLCLSAAITYSGLGADFFVYFTPSTSQWKIFTATFLGLVTSFTFAFVAGIGLASGIATTPAYHDAYGVSQGALIVEGLAMRFGHFGKFVAFVILLSLVSNTIAPSYAVGIDFQMLARFAETIPRFVWNTCGVIIYTVCALAGRNSLSVIFTNFLALMGYWLAIWLAITLEEQFIFRNPRFGFRDITFDWTEWNQAGKLPLGIAALIAFLVGWAGAIISMAQIWYIGPIAHLVGDFGADMGNYVGFTWAGLVYPPLRWYELRRFKR